MLAQSAEMQHSRAAYDLPRLAAASMLTDITSPPHQAGKYIERARDVATFYQIQSSERGRKRFKSFAIVALHYRLRRVQQRED
jgi:hypothetical protein